MRSSIFWFLKHRFELEAHYIVYKKSEDDSILAAIDMRGVESCTIDGENTDEHLYELHTGTQGKSTKNKSCKFTLHLGGVVPRKYPLKASTRKETEMWVNAINQRYVFKIEIMKM